MLVIAAKVKIKMQNNSPRSLKHAAEVNDALHSGEKRSEERRGNMGGDHCDADVEILLLFIVFVLLSSDTKIRKTASLFEKANDNLYSLRITPVLIFYISLS